MARESYERVKNSLLFEGPDQVPYFRWDKPEISDIVGTWLGMEDRPSPDIMEWTDPWGCVWQTDHTDMGHVMKSPITSAEGYNSYKFPEIPEAKFEKVFSTLNEWPDKFRAAGIVSFYFQHMMHLRGFQDLLMDLMTEEPGVAELADRLTILYKEIIDRYAESGVVDCILINEDIGLQDRLVMSPELWRSFFKPRYREVYDHAHSRGILVFQHSCGHILDIMQDLAEIGVNVVEMQQTANMGLANIAKARGGAKIAVTAPVDIQAILPGGDKKAIADYSEELFTQLANKKGGYVAQTYSHLSSINVSTETDRYQESLLLELCKREVL